MNMVHKKNAQKNYVRPNSKSVRECFLATEDSRFYEHHGIDIKRTAKAIFREYNRRIRLSRGGSTITQQVIKKNYFLSPKKDP
ncbi:hypothetical protein GCM10020331_067000 [Ectobacillus funiculus]